jgi:predicted Ser/Thr protein kinase
VGFINGVRCVRKEYTSAPASFDTEVAMQTIAAAAGVAPRVLQATENTITMEQVYAAEVTADDLKSILAVYKSLDQLNIIHNSADPKNLMKTKAGKWVLVDFGEAREKRKGDSDCFNADISFTILCTRVGHTDEIDCKWMNSTV